MAERSHSWIERLLISLTIISFSDYCLAGKYMFYIFHHGISILQSRSLEDLLCHFTVGQGWPKINPNKTRLSLGYFTWFFKCWYIHFTVGSHFAFYGLRFELTILQQLWYNHSTVKNMFFGQKITILQAFPILQCKMVVPSTPCLFQRGCHFNVGHWPGMWCPQKNHTNIITG